MQKIDKGAAVILSTKYKSWLEKLNASGNAHDGNYRYYYDDVAMNLYRCQWGVCAYTEMRICIPELYAKENWEKGRHKISEDADYNRRDHFGQLDHFDPDDKATHYWNWDNLFMIHSTINLIKTGNAVISYLKPDLPDYSPEKYFDYDEQTHRFVPNTDIADRNQSAEIQYMIDKVLCLNHGVVRNERRNYIKLLESKKQNGEPMAFDRFFTAAKWVLVK
jgi:hypothetical protein